MPAPLGKNHLEAGPVATLIGSVSRHKIVTDTVAAIGLTPWALKVASVSDQSVPGSGGVARGTDPAKDKNGRHGVILPSARRRP